VSIRNILSVLLVLSGSCVTTACQQMHDSPDYERHVNSRLTTPMDGGDYIWFDVKLSASMPLEDETAEARRQVWLQTWLLQRKLCPNGYEVLERRPFEFLEYNPEQLDLRYKVSCLAAQSDATD